MMPWVEEEFSQNVAAFRGGMAFFARGWLRDEQALPSQRLQGKISTSS